MASPLITPLFLHEFKTAKFANADDVYYTFTHTKEDDVEETECERRYKEIVVLRENGRNSGLEFPDCSGEGGLFAERQCSGFGAVCWCVDRFTGDELAGTRSESGLSVKCGDDVEEESRGGRGSLLALL